MMVHIGKRLFLGAPLADHMHPPFATGAAHLPRLHLLDAAATARLTGAGSLPPLRPPPPQRLTQPSVPNSTVPRPRSAAARPSSPPPAATRSPRLHLLNAAAAASTRLTRGRIPPSPSPGVAALSTTPHQRLTLQRAFPSPGGCSSVAHFLWLVCLICRFNLPDLQVSRWPGPCRPTC